MLSVMRPDVLRRFDSFIFPGQLFGRFKPAGSPSIEERDGIEYWRLDAVPRERQGPFARLTAWFDAANFSLRASHAILPLPGRARLSIRTNYETIDGLDVPIRRVIKGSIPMRRRMRMFFSDFEQIIRYSDYELKFQE